MKIQFKLSADSVASARQQIIDRKQWLIDKNAEFVKKLAEYGIPTVESRIEASRGDSSKEHYTHVEIVSFQAYAKATLVVEGRDILFIEYGAGIHYNGVAGSSPNPVGADKGYYIGSYGKGYGKKDFWFYRDGTGALQKSYGTEATMPVYEAYKDIKHNVLKIAKEVFNG